MERKLARYLFRTPFTNVVHHLTFEFGQTYWDARLLCLGFLIDEGVISTTVWEDRGFSLEEPVTCLFCLVTAGTWSS